MYMQKLNSMELESRLAEYYHVPLLEACILMQIDLAELRECMKKCGITRWPYNYKRQHEASLEKTNLFNNFKIGGQIGEDCRIDLENPFESRITMNPTKKMKMDIKLREIPPKLPSKLPFVVTICKNTSEVAKKSARNEGVADERLKIKNLID
jgi:hypothetical protein